MDWDNMKKLTYESVQKLPTGSMVVERTINDYGWQDGVLEGTIAHSRGFADFLPKYGGRIRLTKQHFKEHGYYLRKEGKCEKETVRIMRGVR
jgi:hypothetical protein